MKNISSIIQLKWLISEYDACKCSAVVLVDPSNGFANGDCNTLGEGPDKLLVSRSLVPLWKCVLESWSLHV